MFSVALEELFGFVKSEKVTRVMSSGLLWFRLIIIKKVKGKPALQTGYVAFERCTGKAAKI